MLGVRGHGPMTQFAVKFWCQINLPSFRKRWAASQGGPCFGSWTDEPHLPTGLPLTCRSGSQGWHAEQGQARAALMGTSVLSSAARSGPCLVRAVPRLPHTRRADCDLSRRPGQISFPPRYHDHEIVHLILSCSDWDASS